MSYMDPSRTEFADEELLTQEPTQEFCSPHVSKIKPSFLIDYLAGVAGGISVVLIGHPFDTTKTRLQTSPRGFYKGTLDCVRKTFMWEGLGGFYAGMMSPMMGQMVFRAVSFSTYYRTLDYVSDRSHTPTVTQFMVSGAMTGLAVSLIEAPIDLIKIKLQTQIFLSSHLVSSREPLTHLGPAYNSVFGCVRHIARTDGMLALWQGWRATAIRNVPANTCFFPVFEMTKISLAKQRNVPVEDLELVDRLVAGAVAGLGFWVLTFPLDVIKARMQANTYKLNMSLGWQGTAKLIYAERGWMGFTRGLAPCALRAIPACATMFATVDIVRAELTKLQAFA